MNVETFLAHHGLRENPFDAEEARHDRVLPRMLQEGPTHPDFAKILGQLNSPSTSIVFGEKGSGKTAIRLLIGDRVAIHNQQHPDQKTLLIVYDNLNPYLDRVVHKLGRRQRRGALIDKQLEKFRLDDHQDAILSLAVTALVDALLDESTESGGSGSVLELPADLNERIKRMPRYLRANLAVLAALYDQPHGGPVVSRWGRLHARLQLGWISPLSLTRLVAIVLTILGGSLLGLRALGLGEAVQLSMLVGGGAFAAAAFTLWGMWLVGHLRIWQQCRRLRDQLPSIERRASELRQMLLGLRQGDRSAQNFPLPTRDGLNRRYELTARLVEVLSALDFVGLTVVIDRVDEPTLISGNAQRMRALVWPMLDNKFLQQDRVGLKMLLPIELRHMLHRESADFFQEARLDKQNLVDRLAWSGATLYDLCASRLRACCDRQEEPAILLTDLFESDVTREMIVDALEQMHQPRDAFKMLYNVIQEHCRMVPQEQSRYEIARLTLENIRRSQSQRVQEFYRGLSPA